MSPLPIREELLRDLSQLLSRLRAMRWNYQTCHWQVFGVSYYGDHLLFQRLYEGMDAEIDGLAERIIGLSGGDYPFDNLSQSQEMTAILQSWAVDSCPHQRSLRSENELQGNLGFVYAALEEAGVKTLGLDDFLASLAGQHESNLYLIQQRLTQHKARRASYQYLLREWSRLAKGVPRSDRNPDYKSYLKRKRDQGEKPMDRATWQKWMDGLDRPDTRERFDSPEDIKEDSKGKKEDSKELSKNDKALLEKAKKTLTKEVQKALKQLSSQKDQELITFLLSDKTTQKKVETELQKLKDQVNRERVREEISEELKAKNIPLPDGSLNDEESLEAARNLFEEGDSRVQFAQALVVALPDELKELAPPNFLLWSLQTILDEMLSFSKNPKDYTSAEDRMKSYETYKKEYDEKKSNLDSIKSKIDDMGEPPEDPEKLKKWTRKLRSLSDKYTTEYRSLEDSTLKYAIKDESRRESIESTLKKQRKVEDETLVKADETLDEADEAKSALQKMQKKQKRILDEIPKVMAKSKAKREAVAESAKRVSDLKSELSSLKEGSEEHKSKSTALESAESVLKSAEEDLAGDFKPLLDSMKKTGAESSEVTEAEGDVADWVLDELVDRLSDLTEKNVSKVIDKMVSNQSGEKLAALYFAADTSHMTAEKYFFDNPEDREVLQFARSKQISNLTKKDQKNGAPPTVVDIHRQEGKKTTFSTLHRLVIDTKEPVKERGHVKRDKVAWDSWTVALEVEDVT